MIAVARPVVALARPEERSTTVGSVLVMGLAASAVSFVAHFTTRSHFFFDDYLWFRQAQREGMSLDFLLQPMNPHLAPGHRLVDWLFQRVFPLDFPVAQALLLGCFAGTVLVLHHILATLFGPGPGPLVLSLVYGTSILHVGVIQWWNGGLLTLPAALLSLLSILAYLRFYETGSRRTLAWSVVALCVGLLFYVKVVLVPLYLLLLRVLLLERERPARQVLRDSAREWRTWALYAAPVGLYLVVFLTSYWEPSGLPSPGLIGDYLHIAWVRVFAPSVLGWRILGTDVPAVDQAAIVGAQVAVGALVVASVVRWRPAWRAWAFFGIAFVLNALIVGLPRLSGWGAGIAYFPRYHLEATYLFPMALGGAFLTSRRAAPPAPPPAPRARPRRLAALGGAGLAVVLIAYLSWAWSGATRLSEESPGRLAGPYIENAKASLVSITGAGIRPTVLDGTVPDYVFASWAAYGPPYQNRLSEVLPLIEPEITFDRPSSTLYQVGGDGTLQQVAFTPVAGGWAPGLWQQGTLAVRTGVAEREGGRLCVRPAPGSPANLELALPAPVSGAGWYLELRYATDVAQTVRLSIDRGRGYPLAADGFVPVALEAGADGSALVALSGEGLSGLRLNLVPPGRWCVDRIEVGRVVASP